MTKKMKNDTKTTPVKDWNDINSIIEGSKTVHMGELPHEKLKKIHFLIAETENFKLLDSLREEGKSLYSYLSMKYPSLSDKSISALQERARFMDR